MVVCDNGNGAHSKIVIERHDWAKGITIAIAVLTVFAGVMLFVFKTNMQAAVEHAAIEQTQALHEQEVELRREYDNKADLDTKAILKTLDTNQRILMQRVGVNKKKIEALPASINFDDLEDLENGP